tara:strand:+ start:747 stop:1295 length:549 start_codon:yes stop_codon:yes gene_type:complete
MEITEFTAKMDQAINHLEKEYSGLRTSRANPSMLDNILIDAYGSKTPLSQLGNISVIDPGTLSIQIWDSSLINTVEKSILDSNLGLNPQTDGNLIRLPIPKLSEERRNELSKIASQYAEKTKIVIRNIRREFNDNKKREKKDLNLSDDDVKKLLETAQSKTDEYIKKIDSISESKINDILKV